MAIRLASITRFFGTAFGNTGLNQITNAMKKTIMVMSTLGMICLFMTAKAQTVGAKGGFNISDVSGMNGNSRVSGHAGLYFNSVLGKGWAIQPELLYSGEGEKYHTALGDRVLALSYINVPVMFQYYPAKQVYVEFGPQLGVLASAGVKDTNGNKVDVRNDYSRFAMSAGLGVGIKATDQVGFNARYNFGLTDITVNNNAVNYSNCLQVGIAVRINE